MHSNEVAEQMDGISFSVLVKHDKESRLAPTSQNSFFFLAPIESDTSQLFSCMIPSKELNLRIRVLQQTPKAASFPQCVHSLLVGFRKGTLF